MLLPWRHSSLQTFLSMTILISNCNFSNTKKILELYHLCPKEIHFYLYNKNLMICCNNIFFNINTIAYIDLLYLFGADCTAVQFHSSFA